MVRTNYLDLVTSLDPDGSYADVAEVLHQDNPMLQDGHMTPSNADTYHKVTIRSSLPGTYWTKMNQGTPRTKSSKRQQVDGMGMITAMSDVDSRGENINAPAFRAHRASEDEAFLESMAQEIAGTGLYGNVLTEDAAFTGLQPRLETLNTSITGSAVRAHHTSPSGSDYTSIYVTDWGPRGVSWLHPKNAKVAGLDWEDKGEHFVTDAGGTNQFLAAITSFTQVIGLTVKDPRRIGRLCNIDISQALSDTTTLLVNSLIQLLNQMKKSTAGFNRVLYTHRDIVSAFEIQAKSKSTVNLTMQEYLGEMMVHIRGYPIRIMDQVSASESLVS